jgi:predicted acyltransferase
VACLALGYLWSLWFPLNKNMWTSSYVLVAAGWSLTVLTLVFYLADVLGWRKGWTWPWLVLGSNAITIYMFSDLAPYALTFIHFTANGKPTNPVAWVTDPLFTCIPNPGLAAFAYSFAILLFCFIPGWILYRMKIFIKV